ncbi:MAG: hypothetical protein M3347_13450 [Armatimonadota bacterium]|nr:hypothetical protein [Armatimonadota bacterium]
MQRRFEVESTAPGDTVTADPLFADWQNGDYRYQAGSPALKLGLEPIDVSRVGRLKVQP